MENQPANTLPLLSKEGKVLTRQFDGKTENFESKQERSFYTKGASQFPTGRFDNNQIKYSEVEQSYLYV
jgi:hypothetical protein